MPVDATTAELRRLQSELDALKTETRINTGALAATVRKTRLSLAVVEQNESVRKLRQPTSVLDWHPRPGVPTDPNLQNGLLDRLRQGNPVADSLGNVDAYVGQVNLLDDPLWDGFLWAVTTVNVAEAAVAWTPSSPAGLDVAPTAGWYASKTAGTVATATIDPSISREVQATNPFNSRSLLLRIVPTGAGTHELMLRSIDVAFSVPSLPYLVGGVRLARFGAANTLTGITSRSLILEIYDTTDLLVRATSTTDLAALSETLDDQYLANVALSWNGLTAAQKLHQFRLRIRLVVVGTGATGNVRYNIGEPQLQWSASPETGSFGPLVVSFVPTALVAPAADGSTRMIVLARAAGDTNWRFQMQASGQMSWGTGAAVGDVGIKRVSYASKTQILLEDPYSAAVGGALTTTAYGVTAAGISHFGIRQSGDTTYRARFTSSVDGATVLPGLTFQDGAAASPDLRLYRGAAGKLYLDGNGSDIYVVMIAPAGGRSILQQYVAADAFFRAELRGDAIGTQLMFGGGAVAADMRIARTAASVLRIDDGAGARATIEGAAGVAPATPGAGLGRLYFSSVDKLWHSIDDAGVNTALGAGGGGAAVGANTITLSSAAGNGVAVTALRGDAVIAAFDITAPVTQAIGDAAAVGVINFAARRDHKHGMPAFATNAVLLSSAAAAGAATTPMRSNDTIAAFDATAPVTQAFSDVAAVGVINFAARRDHKHGMPAGSLSGHGAADHADITRKLYLNANLATLDTATLANIGASPDLTRVVAYADAATQGAFWNFMVPSDWASGVITIQPIWSPGATDAVAHTVRWSMTTKAIAAGSTVTAAGTTVAFTGASAVRTVGVVVFDTATSTTLTPAAAGDAFRVTMQRIGADAADTYLGVVNLLGLIVSYTANQ